MEDLSAQVMEVQRIVGVEPDGVAGPNTWAAILTALGRGGSHAAVGYIFDLRSEQNIGTLTTATQKVAREFLHLLIDSGIAAKIISGSRTYEEQDALERIGRRGIEGEKIVTNAKGGYSSHNFGIAFDIGIFDHAGHYLDESPLYARAGIIGKGLGLSWGGDWHTIQDEPHFELRPSWAYGATESEMLAKLREDKNATAA